MLITDLGYQVICSRSLTNNEKELIIMIPISEKEELALDNGFLQTVRGGHTFNINNNKEQSDIIAYGEIDFHDDSDDFDVIQGMNWLSHLSYRGICVPSDYNYDEHCCYSPNNKARYYDTTNPAIVAQYVHGVLGKPKLCCIFKEKIYASKRP